MLHNTHQNPRSRSIIRPWQTHYSIVYTTHYTVCSRCRGSGDCAWELQPKVAQIRVHNNLLQPD